MALCLRADPDVRLRLAFAQLRAGQAREAVQSAQQALDGKPGDVEALLVLGLAQRAAHHPASGATLSQFLATAPDHPAAPEVRRLLEEPNGTP